MRAIVITLIKEIQYSHETQMIISGLLHGRQWEKEPLGMIPCFLERKWLLSTLINNAMIWNITKKPSKNSVLFQIG